MRSELHLSSRKTLPNGGGASASTASNFFLYLSGNWGKSFNFGILLLATQHLSLACRSDSDRDVVALLTVDLGLVSHLMLSCNTHRIAAHIDTTDHGAYESKAVFYRAGLKGEPQVW